MLGCSAPDENAAGGDRYPRHVLTESDSRPGTAVADDRERGDAIQQGLPISGSQSAGPTGSCPSCSATNAGSARFCASCGNPLSLQGGVRDTTKSESPLPAGLVGAAHGVGGSPLAPAASHRSRRFYGLITVFAVLTLIVAGGVVGGVRLTGKTPDRAFLAALRQGGLSGQFNGDAVAIAHARSFCHELSAGAASQGGTADEVAVKYYCPKFSPGFHVLQTITVSGDLQLSDTTNPANPFATPGIQNSSSGCLGAGGYVDINASTDVVVTDPGGRVLATTPLGPGYRNLNTCSFGFQLPITEGATDYGVTISHRGTQHYTFAQLRTNGLTLTLGGTPPTNGSSPAAPAPARTGEPADRLLGGCPLGPTIAHTKQPSGLQLTLIQASQFDVELCLTLPTGQVVHPAPDPGSPGYGSGITTFSDQTYFAVDSLGHTFINITPGNLAGVAVVIPQGNSVKIIGPVPGARVDQSTTPFHLKVSRDDCHPNCAQGQTTYTFEDWDAQFATYVLN